MTNFITLCRISLVILVFASTVFSMPNRRYEGAVCRLENGKKGLCKRLSQCKPASERLRTSRIIPVRCSFQGWEEVVCCDDEEEAPEALTSLRKSEQACQEYSNEISPRVIPLILGGEQVDEGEFPHMAALGYSDPSDKSRIAWNCGGTLISNKHVLTAAHCVVPTTRTKSPVQILLGAVNLNNLDSKVQKYHVKSWKVHPDYTTQTAYNDIAIIELDKTVKFSDTVQPACLYTKSDIPNVGLKITGWGSTSNGRSIKSPTLQKAVLKLVPNNKCNEQYVNERRVNKGVVEGMMCAGDPDGKMDTCDGDSGGPLLLPTTDRNIYSVVGVTSIGPSVCGGVTPAVYTRVSSYVDWIESVVWG